MPSFMDRAKAAFNVLTNTGSGGVEYAPQDVLATYGPMYGGTISITDSTKTILAPIVTRIAIDVASIPIRHVLLDEHKRLKEYKESELNDRLTIRANLDQSGVAFIHDAVSTMLFTGSVALVPIETDSNPVLGTFDIMSVRAAPITDWYNRTVEVHVYNEMTGEREYKILPKAYVGIAYNPLYAVMNEPNSTLRRLVDRLALLDVADGKLFSPQLDLILQMPYSLKSSRQRDEAERRATAIEEQLGADRKYGIAYVGATEKITQLNRPVTNDLVKTVEGLASSLHSQLGLTPAVFSGNAEQGEMVNYYNRTVAPIIKALTDAMVGSFLTRTAIRQGHSVMAFPDLFKMAPLLEVADAADKLTRNEVVTSNEVRVRIGLPPAKSPEADELRNKNLNKPVEPGQPPPAKEEINDKEQD
jgi:hypothetical protein